MKPARMAAISKLLGDYAVSIGDTLVQAPPNADLLHQGKDDKELVDEICARLRIVDHPKRYTVAVADANTQVIVDPTVPPGKVGVTDPTGKRTYFDLEAVRP